MSSIIIKNEQIKSRFVKLIDEEKLIGIVALNEAIGRARSKGLDLVLITEGDNPICKILDADSYRYEKAKHEKEQAKKQRIMIVETKEIQLRPVTDSNDIQIKAKAAQKFLSKGDKVKVIVKFRNREKSHKELGYNIINQFLENIGEHKVEKTSDTGNDLIVLIAPVLSKTELAKQKESK